MSEYEQASERELNVFAYTKQTERKNGKNKKKHKITRRCSYYIITTI